VDGTGHDHPFCIHRQELYQTEIRRKLYKLSLAMTVWGPGYSGSSYNCRAGGGLRSGTVIELEDGIVIDRGDIYDISEW
jgi:hypothetical protein